MDTQLSDHFWLSEFTASQTAARLGRPVVVETDPDDPVFQAIKALCIHVLEPVRAVFGRVIISSGYRPEWLNDTLPGTANKSQHSLGEAADFTCPGHTVEAVARFIADPRNAIPFDQLIWEFDAWCHVSYSPRHRLQVLTAKHGPDSGTGVQVTYQPGLVPFETHA